MSQVPLIDRGRSCVAQSLPTTCRTVAIAFWLAVVTLTAMAAEVQAAASQAALRVSSRFGPSSTAEKQPKKAVLTQVMDRGFAGTKGTYRFCLKYERTSEIQPDKGTISATVELLNGGGSRRVATLSKTKVFGRRAKTCTAAGIELEVGDILVWSFKFKGMPKVPSGALVEFGGEVLAPGEPFGVFRLSGTGTDHEIQYFHGPNLVFCRTDAGFADLWVRLAEEVAAEGENGAHIDIDVCNYQEGGRFQPLDPTNPSCSGAKTWDVFWHDAGARVYQNKVSSKDCELTLSVEGDHLGGTFACKGLVEPGTGEEADLLEGVFRCDIE